MGRKIVVVLGMHRSGTSAVAHLLHTLGVPMGVEFLPPDENNPLGYWEDTTPLGINKGILANAGGSWKNPPGRNKLLQLNHKHQTAVRAYIERREDERIWGFKDPRTTLTAHLWHHYLTRQTPNVYYLNVLRNGADIARSVEKAHGKHPHGWDRVILHYQQQVSIFMRERAINARSISYTTIMRDKTLANYHLMGIAQWLELDVTRNDVATAVNAVLRYPQVVVEQ